MLPAPQPPSPPSVCCDPHLALESPPAFGMPPWHLATDTSITGGGFSVPAPFIPCQGSVVSQDSKFSLPHEWRQYGARPHQPMSVSLVRENLCSDPLPPAGHEPPRPGGVRSVFLLPKEAVEPLVGPEFWPKQQLLSKSAWTRPLRTALPTEKNMFHGLPEVRHR